MSDSYWVRYKGRSIGPYALDRVRQMVRKGQVGRSHDVSTDGASWVPATSFPEIFEPPAAFAPTVAQAAATAVAQPQPIAVAPVTEAGPPAEAAIWYYAVDGAQQGPMPRSQVVGLIRSGRLSRGDLVFRSGMADWTAAAEAPELAAAFAALGPAAGGGPIGVDAFCRACGTGINKHAVICPKCGAPAGDGMPAPIGAPLVFAESRGQRRQGDKKSKTVAALLALLVGGLGAHHFYLNNPVLGIFYLVFCFTLIPAIIAFIEAIIFLTMSDEAFDAKYNS
jgi:TM2 domain-containing membrane protein YozV